MSKNNPLRLTPEVLTLSGCVHDLLRKLRPVWESLWGYHTSEAREEMELHIIEREVDTVLCEEGLFEYTFFASGVGVRLKSVLCEGIVKLKFPTLVDDEKRVLKWNTVLFDSGNIKDLLPKVDFYAMFEPEIVDRQTSTAELPVSD